MNPEFFEPPYLLLAATLMVVPLAIPLAFLRFVIFSK